MVPWRGEWCPEACAAFFSADDTDDCQGEALTDLTSEAGTSCSEPAGPQPLAMSASDSTAIPSETGASRVPVLEPSTEGTTGSVDMTQEVVDDL